MFAKTGYRISFFGFRLDSLKRLIASDPSLLVAKMVIACACSFLGPISAIIGRIFSPCVLTAVSRWSISAGLARYLLFKRVINSRCPGFGLSGVGPLGILLLGHVLGNGLLVRLNYIIKELVLVRTKMLRHRLSQASQFHREDELGGLAVSHFLQRL